VALSAFVHLFRELRPEVAWERDGDTLVLKPKGVLWFGSAPALEDAMFARLAEEDDVRHVVVRCGGLGRIDLSGAYTLAELLVQCRLAGIETRLEEIPAHAARLLHDAGVTEVMAGEGASGEAGTEGVSDS